MDHLIDNFDFGSHGQVSISITREYPQVQCIVQDLLDAISGLDSKLPEDLKDCDSGIAYGFLTLQPVKGADIHLFRWILLRWFGRYCVKIL